MPVWNKKTAEWVREGKLVVLGVAQEQHPERCGLFAQWKRLGWPIVYDPINLMGVRGVPIEVAIDENGIVRSIGVKTEWLGAKFVDKEFESQGAGRQRQSAKAVRPDVAVLRSRAEASGAFEAWRAFGDTVVLWGGVGWIEEAIEAYKKAIEAKPKDGASHFRLGVCYRMRYESAGRKDGDFRAAVEAWSRAREIEPNQYIWRRKLEQYGPRLGKPYPFYDWVEVAGREIRARGERPIELRVLPGGSEVAGPVRRFDVGEGKVESPDAKGRIARDVKGLVEAEVTVVPPRVKAGESARVYVTLRPNEKLGVHWNNEAEALRLWVDGLRGWKVWPRLSVWPAVKEAESGEARQFEFEVQAPAGAAGAAEIEAYALYYVCEGVGGACYYLRQDIGIGMNNE